MSNKHVHPVMNNILEAHLPEVRDRLDAEAEAALAIGQPADGPVLDPDGNISGPDYGDGPEFAGWEDRSNGPR